MDNPNLDIQTGEAITEKSLSGDESYEFEYDERAIFRRLSNDIYESREAGIREPVTNAVTAIHTAVNDGHISEQEGQLRVSVHDNGEMHRLVIEDNGIGISSERLENVLSSIGKSTSISDGDQAGQFGMGFLAIYQLVGEDGGFKMETKSRNTDEVIAGIWHNSGFERFHAMEDDRPYGTRFEIDVRSDITTQDLCNWIRRNIKFARTTTVYQHFDDDGDLCDDDEWANDYTIMNDHDTVRKISIETEFFDVWIARYMCNERILLLDVPVDVDVPRLGGKYGYQIYNSIRLKHENGVVVNGELKGTEVVEQNPSDGQVRFDELPDDAVVTPTPTGTRDSLKWTDSFFDWLDEYIEKYIEQHITDLLHNNESLDDLTVQEHGIIEWLVSDVSNPNGKPRHDHVGNSIQNVLSEYGGNERLVKQLVAINGEIERVERNARHPESNTCRHQADEEDIESNDYIASTINEEKAHKVWEQDADVYKVERSVMYEPLQQLTDCNLLKNVDVSDDDCSAETTTMTVHRNDGGTHRRAKQSLHNLEKELEETPQLFLVFIPSSEYRIRSWYRKTELPKVRVKQSVWDETLEQYDDAVLVENYVENMLDHSIPTPYSDTTFRTIDEQYEDVAVYVVTDEDGREILPCLDIAPTEVDDVVLVTGEESPWMRNALDVVSSETDITLYTDSYELNNNARMFDNPQVCYNALMNRLPEDDRELFENAFSKNYDTKAIYEAFTQLVEPNIDN